VKYLGISGAYFANCYTRQVQDVAKYPGLTRRGKRWSYRRRVPDELRTTVGAREIVISLGAVDHREAERLARLKSVEVDRRFAEARAKLRIAPIETVSTAELQHLARAYFYRLETTAAPAFLSEDDRLELLERSRENLAAFSNLSSEDAALQRVAMDFGQRANVRLDPTKQLFWLAIDAIRRANIEHYSIN